MINKLSELHAGTQPIRVLQFNIAHHFETTNPEFLDLAKKTISKQGLQPGIGYYISEEPIEFLIDGHIQTPYVDPNKKIYIHETFLSYVWCISYSLYVLYDEAIVKLNNNQLAGTKINDINQSLVTAAEDLFKYAISLIK